MYKPYICDYFANNQDGDSVRVFSEIIYSSGFIELIESIMVMTNHHMEQYEAFEVLIDVYEWASGNAKKYFSVRVNQNLPINIII